MAKGIIFKTDGIEYVDDKNLGFEGLKKRLGFEWADVVVRKIGGKEYYIMCDDEGRLKEKEISLLIVYSNGAIEDFVGNIFVCDYISWDDESWGSNSSRDIFNDISSIMINVGTPVVPAD